MSTPTELAVILRLIRKESKLTRRAFAERIGVKMRTVDNAEYSKHRVLGKRSIERIVEAFALDEQRANELRAASAALGASPYMEAQRSKWDRANAKRTKDRGQSRELRSALVLVLRLHTFIDSRCECNESQECELCCAMRVLSLGRWNPETASDALAKEVDLAFAFFESAKQQPQATDDEFGGA